MAPTNWRRSTLRKRARSNGDPIKLAFLKPNARVKRKIALHPFRVHASALSFSHDNLKVRLFLLLLIKVQSGNFASLEFAAVRRGGNPLFIKNNAVRFFPALTIALLLCVADASASTKLLRFPDIHGDRVA